MREVDAAAHDRGGKARQIADDAAAKRDNEVTAFDADFQQPLGDTLQLVEAFGCFACRHDHCVVANGLRIEACIQRGQMKSGDRLVCDDSDAGTAQKRFQMRACIRDQAGADQNVIAAIAKFDADGSDGGGGTHLIGSSFFCAVAGV